MSKQVMFYQDAEDTKAFAEFITSNCGTIFTQQGEMVSADEVQQIAIKTSESILYIVCSDTASEVLKLFFSKPFCYSVNAIEYALCKPQERFILDSANIYKHLAVQFPDAVKDGYVVMRDDPAFIHEIDNLMRTTEKIKNPDFFDGIEPGRIYLPKRTDRDALQKNSLKDISILYKKMERYIKNNYVCSETKFAYIGSSAFKRYKDKNFIPCQGKNKIIF